MGTTRVGQVPNRGHFGRHAAHRPPVCHQIDGQHLPPLRSPQHARGAGEGLPAWAEVALPVPLRSRVSCNACMYASHDHGPARALTPEKSIPVPLTSTQVHQEAGQASLLRREAHSRGQDVGGPRVCPRSASEPPGLAQASVQRHGGHVAHREAVHLRVRNCDRLSGASIV